MPPARRLRTRTLAKMGAGALAWKVRRRRRPLNVMIAVTNACNARCAYCAIPAREQPELSTDALLRLIDEVADAGAARVGLWGGEPLVRRDIGAIVDRCAERGLWTTMVTNGYLYPRKAEEIRRIDHLLISYDGDAAAHERNREPGAHAKVTAAIQAAARRGQPFWTLTVLTRHNLDQIEHVLDLAERHGAQAMFQVLHHGDELADGKGDAMAPDDARYRDALDRLDAARRAGRPVAMSPVALRALRSWPDFAVPVMDRPHAGLKCVAGRLSCNIDADGRVYACSLRVGLDDAPSAVQEGGFARAFAALGDPPCQSCSATAFTEYNALFALDPRAVVGWVARLAGR